MNIKQIDLKKIDKPVRTFKRFQTDDSNIKELADNMRQIGLLNPITVMENKGRFALLAGYRRFLAAQYLKWDTIDCNIVTGNDFFISFSENEQRFDPSDVERGFWLKSYMDFLKDEKDEKTGKKFSEAEKPIEAMIAFLAAKLSTSPRTIYRYLQSAKKVTPDSKKRKDSKKKNEGRKTNPEQEIKRTGSWFDSQTPKIVEKLKFVSKNMAEYKSNKKMLKHISVIRDIANAILGK